ncbi:MULTISPECIES: competence type IV pilus minor pilin ComGD [Vagococcus]|uniref:Late competence protein ComGD, access of DNA to ComEA, FIG038316 n=1 Tax=Vagococcus fluvialis bH819 TaxID=1255619 RepID=A0A1X6WMI2_9ENTE|nr:MULTISPECIES: competence type IV pilus minor pilin ComGD [Vagococcus]SLM85543.1 hypothetical protein FM121_05545 [Vagococcus fluvialis bH819]HCM89510.1 prepilin-type N-terminal cleavage/methylation domain-containing protein [Vagococcus sp.]
MKVSSDDGFTLIECLLVLMIIGIFITIPIIGIKKWQEKNQVEIFLSQVERKIQETHQSAIIWGIDTKISQEPDKQLLKFDYYYYGRNSKEDLHVEKPLTLRSSEKIEFKGVSGNIKKIQGIRFVDESRNREIKYNFQLGSGKVIRNEKNL